MTRILSSVVFLIVLLAGDVVAEDVPRINPLHCLPIANAEMGSIGTMTPISETQALSCDHVTRGREEPDLRLFTIQLSVKPSTTDDTVASVITLPSPIKFSSFFPPGTAVTGTAWVLRPDSVHKITIADTDRQTFFGWLPYRGNSGSGIVQCIDGKFVMVGVARAKGCDDCIICNQIEGWDCHCPDGGFYAKTPKYLCDPPR